MADLVIIILGNASSDFHQVSGSMGFSGSTSYLTFDGSHLGSGQNTITFSGSNLCDSPKRLVYISGTLEVMCNITASGHVSASTYYGDGSNLSGISGGSGTPGGSNTHVQYNSGGSFAGTSNLTYDGTTLTANQIVASNGIDPRGGGPWSVQIGNNAAAGWSYAMGIGPSAAAGANKAIAIGYSAQASAENSIALGSGSVNATANSMVIGNASQPMTLNVTGAISASQGISANTYYGDGSNLSGISSGGSAADSDQTILAVQVFG